MKVYVVMEYFGGAVCAFTSEQAAKKFIEEETAKEIVDGMDDYDVMLAKNYSFRLEEVDLIESPLEGYPHAQEC